MINNVIINNSYFNKPLNYKEGHHQEQKVIKKMIRNILLFDSMPKKMVKINRVGVAAMHKPVFLTSTASAKIRLFFGCDSRACPRALHSLQIASF